MAAPPVVSAIPEVQAHYLLCRRNGCAHGLAEMLALQKAPRGVSDGTFLAGKWNQFQDTPHIGDVYKSAAVAGGQCVKGKVYLSGLAEYPGDPRAWVETREDVRKVCEDRGWNAEGSVNVKGAKGDTPPLDVGLAPDLVEGYAQAAVEADPGLAERPAEEVREMVKDKMAPHWAK